MFTVRFLKKTTKKNATIKKLKTRKQQTNKFFSIESHENRFYADREFPKQSSHAGGNKLNGIHPNNGRWGQFFMV